MCHSTVTHAAMTRMLHAGKMTGAAAPSAMPVTTATVSTATKATATKATATMPAAPMVAAAERSKAAVAVARMAVTAVMSGETAATVGSELAVTETAALMTVERGHSAESVRTEAARSKPARSKSTHCEALVTVLGMMAVLGFCCGFLALLTFLAVFLLAMMSGDLRGTVVTVTGPSH